MKRIKLMCGKCHHDMQIHGPLGCYKPLPDSPVDKYGHPEEFCQCLEFGTYGRR